MSRASDAERLLADPAFQSAMEGIEGQIVDRLKSAQLDGKEETERYALELVRCLQAQARLSRHLWQQVEHGKLEEHALEQRKRWKKGGL